VKIDHIRAQFTSFVSDTQPHFPIAIANSLTNSMQCPILNYQT